MTELLIVTKPRGRLVQWIGGGVFKPYKGVVTLASKSDTAGPISISQSDVATAFYSGSNTRCAQQFLTANKSNIRLREVQIRWSRTGSPSGTVYFELWSDNNNTLGSKIADIGTYNIGSIPTSFTTTTITAPTNINLSANTKYWVVVVFSFSSSSSSNYVSVVRSNSDVYADGGAAIYVSSWSYTTSYDWNISFVPCFKSFTFTHSVSLDFQYYGVATKRLAESGTTRSGVTISGITVNGTSVGASIENTDNIPQADSYTITYSGSVDDGTIVYNLTPKIQRYLLYDKTFVTLDDLNLSDAYIQKIKFNTAGYLMIDDNPDAVIVGAANEVVDLSNILAPFRKLEWRDGASGEVLIYGVE